MGHYLSLKGVSHKFDGIQVRGIGWEHHLIDIVLYQPLASEVGHMCCILIMKEAVVIGMGSIDEWQGHSLQGIDIISCFPPSPPKHQLCLTLSATTRRAFHLSR